MSFAARDARLTASVLKHLSDPVVFTPAGGEAMETDGIFDPETVVEGDLGQAVDPRPSIALSKAVVGDMRQGTVQVHGKTYALDRLISDDGQMVHFFVH